MIHFGLRLTLIAAVVSTLGACHGEEENAGPPPVRPVLYTVAKPIDTIVFGPFAGFVAPRYQSEIGFQIAGRVIARDVTVGDVVKKGQRIAALDPVVTRFALTRAEAELADATAQAENAIATEARQRRLIANGNVTQARLDSAVASRDTAQARLAQAQANLQKARDQMGYTELHADFDGVVTVRSAEVGQVLSAGQAVATLARPEEREAVVDIPEDLVGAMPKDAVFTVALPERARRDGHGQSPRGLALRRPEDPHPPHQDDAAQATGRVPPRLDHHGRTVTPHGAAFPVAGDCRLRGRRAKRGLDRQRGRGCRGPAATSPLRTGTASVSPSPRG